MFSPHSNKEIILLKLKKKKTPFYKSFYNLFQTELSKLRRYFEDSFQKD